METESQSQPVPPHEAPPQTRTVSVIAQDPSVRKGRSGPILMARISIPAEELAPGPTGYRIQVVDYDATRGAYAGAHELPTGDRKEPAAWRKGSPSIVRDPVFRAHNVYALTMKTLARFEFALGRRLGWRFKNHQLKIAPTAMADANAFYSREDEGLAFGYFRGASGHDVYTCLSHDVVVHETTHALLDGLRERFLLPSTPDQAAFHEGFADVIALLSVYTQREIVRALLRPLANAEDAIPRDSISVKGLRETALFKLAEQMGTEIAGIRGRPLRASAELDPDPHRLSTPEFEECHRRGEVLVAAVLHAFLAAWVERVLGALVPGQSRVSVMQVSDEGADIAEALTTMWIRGLDYLPPSDIEFGDVLSAALTADYEVRQDDSRFRLRHHVRTTFAAFGIHPASRETSPERGIWQRAPRNLSFDRVRFESLRTDKDEMFRFLWENRAPDRLDLRTDAFTQVLTIHPCVRVGLDGFTLRETVATYYQVAHMTVDELRQKGIALPRSLVDEVRGLRGEHAGEQAAAEEGTDDDTSNGGQEGPGSVADSAPLFAVYGGATLIFDEYGLVKYRIHSDVFGSRQSKRLAYLWQTGALTVDKRHGGRVAKLRLSALHLQRATDAGRLRRGW